MIIKSENIIKHINTLDMAFKIVDFKELSENIEIIGYYVNYRTGNLIYPNMDKISIKKSELGKWDVV